MKAPAYARGLRGVLKEEAIRSLFAQLREMGVNCVSCKKRLECRGPLHTTAVKFMCNRWEEGK